MSCVPLQDHPLLGVVSSECGRPFLCEYSTNFVVYLRLCLVFLPVCGVCEYDFVCSSVCLLVRVCGVWCLNMYVCVFVCLCLFVCVCVHPCMWGRAADVLLFSASK